MNGMVILFYVFAGLVLLGALGILLTKNVLYGAFMLMISLLAIAVIFILASADFLAVTQIMVYVGGILVLLIFGVMLTNKVAGKSVTTGHHQVWTASILGLVLFTILFLVFYKAKFPVSEQNGIHDIAPLKKLGWQLMTEYVLAFELTGVLLLVALIGASFIAKKQH